jgi:hypothetical protein
MIYVITISVSAVAFLMIILMMIALLIYLCAYLDLVDKNNY